MRTAVLILCLAFASLAQAQVYRWVDAKGTVHYSSEKPPAGVEAKVLNIDAKAGPASPDTLDCYTLRCQGERLEQRLARREEMLAQDAALRAAAAPKRWNGLDFRNYIRISRGMTEGEMLGIAGPPDLAVRDDWSIRTYTYMPTVSDPFTTTISIVSGRVSGLERVRKF
ncbi:MAG TPA: DUF4124 domain-containing protein [Burkholderiales bacterium]|jgi:hypothetical protein